MTMALSTPIIKDTINLEKKNMMHNYMNMHLIFNLLQDVFM